MKMNPAKALAFVAAGLAACLATAGETVTVADEGLVLLHNAYSFSNKTSHVHYELVSTNRLTVQTAWQREGYPASVEAPMFWVDCSDTNDWTFAEEGGNVVVTDVPSKQGSKLAGSRWLTTRPGGGDWQGWGDKQQVKPNPPYFKKSAIGLGASGTFLDCGSKGSNRGLLFSTGPDGYNALSNVGTVIAVWGTETGYGGHLMGGGATLSYAWHRAGDMVVGDAEWGGTARWSAYVFNGNAQNVVKNGTMWHDGNVANGLYSSFNGGWEVISLACTEASAQTCGIGINDKRPGMSWVSGGAEVAEVLLYDRVLSRAEIEKVEYYLGQKWFYRSRKGWNGEGRASVVNAYSGNLVSEINVPAGETLEVGRLTGGSRTGSGGAVPKLTKTGAGTLVFGGEGAQNFAEEITLDEGTISFPTVKPIPTLDQLAPRLYARFDPSVKSSMTLDAEGRVSRWNNLVTTEDARRCNKPFSLQQNVAAQRPTVLEGELCGLPTLDFGENIVNTGMTLWFSTNTVADTTEGVNNYCTLPGIQTVVAVVGAQYGGGTLFDNADFRRSYPDTHDFNRHGFDGMVGKGLNYWSNGRKWNPAKGYEVESYQVSAYQVSGCEVRALFRSDRAYGAGWWYGGGRIGEILIWNRALTEEEVLDAQAYLMAKWFKREMPGYARPEGAFEATDLQYLRSAPGKRVELNVGEGRTVRVGKLTVAGELVKSGAGTLEVEEAEFLYDGLVIPKGGRAEVVGVRDVGSTAELAPGATLHLDVTDTKRILTAMNGSDECVKVWRDKEDRVGLWACSLGGYPQQVHHAPIYTTAANGLNGQRVVDFGVWGDAGKLLYLDRPIHSIRSIYAVMKCHLKEDSAGTKIGGWLFGLGDGLNGDAGGTVNAWYPWREEDDISFHPGLTNGKWDGRFFGGYNNAFAGTGNCRTNGVPVVWDSFKATPEKFQLIELHPQWGVAAGQMGLDREITDRRGGFAIAEIVAYERQLSEREKVATRNYLMKKWLSAGYNDPLPPVPEKSDLMGYQIVVEGEAEYENDEDAEKARIKGEGTLVKTGEGKLTIRDLSEFDGTVDVAEGGLEILYPDPEVTPYLPPNGILYHADATKGITATTNDQNVICVNEWANQGSAPLKAVRSGGNADYQKIVFDPDVGYKPTVDINGYNACMTWQKSDGSSTEIQTLGGIKSIFWMIGSQNGGGFVMGGGTNKTGELSHMWHRGIYYPIPGKTYPNYVGNTNLCTVLNGNMQDAVKPPKANWWKNGETMGWDDYLSGKWDLLSMIVADDATSACASGFAYDGRSRKATGATNQDYNGHQRLAEVICYNRRVSDDERQQIESYLRCKWNFYMHNVADRAIINLGDGATLDLGENAQTFEGITGSGTVNGSLSAHVFKAVVGKSGLKINGKLTILEKPTVIVEGVVQPVIDVGDIPIATAQYYEGLENLLDATFVGLPEGAPARVSLVRGTLVVRVGRSGNVMIVR